MKKLGVFQNRRKYVLPIVTALLAAVVTVNLLAVITYDVSALQVKLGANFGTPGYTRIIIAPIGNITARTHLAPLQFTVSLQNIDLDILRNIMTASELDVGEVLVEDVRLQAHRVVVLFALKILLIAGLGGVFGMFVLGIRSSAALAKGFLIGFFLGASLLGLTLATYDINAFERPQYRGIVEAAPWMIGLMQESLVRVEELGEQIQILASNLYFAFQRIDELKTIGLLEAKLTVLHVSDIHNNPVAYNFARQILESFPVDFVIDTGDLTDWGTPLEAEIVNRIQNLNVLYVFTSGNHDAPDVLERLRQTKNVVLIDNGEKEVHGLRIAGIGDAAALSYSPESAPINKLADTARWINEQYQEKESPPHIFGVHNHRIASAIEPGIFPVVLYGHNHIQSILQRDSSVYINAGTTGAAGIRGLQSRDSIPFSLALLYFAFNNETADYQLIAVDGIEVQGLEASISLNRIFITPTGRNLLEDVELSD